VTSAAVFSDNVFKKLTDKVSWLLLVDIHLDVFPDVLLYSTPEFATTTAKQYQVVHCFIA